jgi:hypothetical protein
VKVIGFRLKSDAMIRHCFRQPLTYRYWHAPTYERQPSSQPHAPVVIQTLDKGESRFENDRFISFNPIRLDGEVVGIIRLGQGLVRTAFAFQAICFDSACSLALPVYY